MLEDHHSSRNEIRMDAAEIDRLDQENALLELEEIVTRVRSYVSNVSEAAFDATRADLR